MNKKDCEHLGYLLSVHYPINGDLCDAIFAMDDRIEPEYELFQEAQGQSDEIVELAEELMREGNPFPQYVKKPGEGRTYAECLEEARRTILGDDYDPSLFRQ